MSDAAWQHRPLAIFGSTGSIGCNTLAVAAEQGIPIHAITGHRNIELLAQQVRQYKPQLVVTADPDSYKDLKAAVADLTVDVAAGPEALDAVAADPANAVVLTAIVGAAGLPSTLQAVHAGKRVCIANKEPLVMAGDMIMSAAAASGATILPVDSEHAAIFQCLEGNDPADVARLLLTASGGPFRQRQDLSQVTIDEALAHPTWSMGQKITIDSATLMNKALEIIEARWLFDLPAEQIEVMIHPQSIIHSMVHYKDGSVLAQLGTPDMRTPIQYALTWPRHTPGSVQAPDFTSMAALTFEEPDHQRFPSLGFAAAAIAKGGTAPTAMNAANEIAVERFLAGDIGFTDIFRLIEAALATSPNAQATDLSSIAACDAETRERTRQA